MGPKLLSCFGEGKIYPGKRDDISLMKCEAQVELYHWVYALSGVDLHSVSHIEMSNYVSTAIDFCKFSQCLSRRIGLFSDCGQLSTAAACSFPYLSLFQHKILTTVFWSNFIFSCLVFMRLHNWNLSIKDYMKYNPFIREYFLVFKPPEMFYVILETPLRQLPQSCNVLNNILITEA